MDNHDNPYERPWGILGAWPDRTDDTAPRSKHGREDRVGLLLALDSEASAVAPCPTIPEHLVDPLRILKLARQLKPVRRGEEAAADAAGEEPSATEATTPTSTDPPQGDQPPEVVERWGGAARYNWHDFGPQLAQAARAMGLLDAARRAFVGDGAESNWTLQRRFFASLVPVRDCIHALS